jgi:hypothetical protein
MPVDTNINPHPPHECLIPGDKGTRYYFIVPEHLKMFAPSSEIDFYDAVPHAYEPRAAASRATCLACDLPFDDPIHVKEQPLA